MKIFLISSLYGISGGGAGIITQHIAAGFASLQNQVSVITIGGSRTCSETIEQGIHVYRFQPVNIYPFDEKDGHPAWQKKIWQLIDIYNFQTAKVLQSILRAESPDIIHINKMRGFSGAVWSVATNLYPGRVIQTCHDYESMSPDGLLRGRIGQMAIQRQTPVREYQRIRAWLSKGVSLVTAPSNFTLKRIQDSGLFSSARTKVVVNTHGWSQKELSSIHQSTREPSNKKVQFLFLGRLEPEKGISVLCEAFLRAYKENSLLSLDIAGWGSLDAVLRQEYSGCLGIRFLGVVSQQVKMDVLNNSDVVVVPSLVEEVFGLTVTEAFAFGRPVIASNIGGLPELVLEGETGWIVEPGNVEALYQRLIRIPDIPISIRKEMGKICRMYSIKYSLENVIDAYEQVYWQLIK